MQIIGVYHAESGLMGELKYIISKVMGTSNCALCDITHGWHPPGKTAWGQVVAQWGNLNSLHINDQSPQMTALTKGKTPCILLAKEVSCEIIVSKEQLVNCEGDIQAMLALIHAALGTMP